MANQEMRPEDRTEMRIVSRQKGTWKWQNAYGVVEYRVREARDGRLLWYSSRDVVRKASMPQLLRMGYGGLIDGSLHNRPVEVER